MARYLTRILFLFVLAAVAVVAVAAFEYRSSGPSSYAGLTRTQARSYSIDFLIDAGAKRNAADILSRPNLEILQALRGRDGDGQKVWKVDVEYTPDGTCIRVLIKRSPPPEAWFGRTADCV